MVVDVHQHVLELGGGERAGEALGAVEGQMHLAVPINEPKRVELGRVLAEAGAVDDALQLGLVGTRRREGRHRARRRCLAAERGHDRLVGCGLARNFRRADGRERFEQANLRGLRRSPIVTLDLSAELVVRARLVRLQTFQPVLVGQVLD